MIAAALEETGGDAADLLDHEFVVALDRHGRPAAARMSEQFTRGNTAAILAFRSWDAYDRHCELSPRTENLDTTTMAGRALVKALADRDDWEALWVDSHTGPNYETPEPLSPGDVHAMLDDQHPRPQCRLLPARSDNEIHLFLDQRGVSHEPRLQTRTDDGLITITGQIQ